MSDESARSDTARPGAFEPVELTSPTGRWVLLATVLGAAIAFLTSTVVNVALPAIGRDLGAGVSGLQWIVNAYMLALASLILLGGSLGDRFGRRRLFVIGTIWFTAASVICAAAPTLPLLVAARVLQGVGGALLTPGSLAIIQATYRREDRARAIGAWSALGGVAAAAGPALGGWLVETTSWRAVFLLNVPFAVVAVYAAVRHVPESRDLEASGRLDAPGAVLGALALAGLTWGFIEAGGGLTGTVVAAIVVGLLLCAAFVVVERRQAEPMLPPDIFSSSQFTWANVLTFVVYAALGVLFFLLVVFLQGGVGYRPFVAGLASLPVTLIMFLLSERGGALAERIGPRLPLTVGPLLIAGGFALLSRLGPDASYLADVLPGLVALGLGLSATVAPVTATVLAAVDDRHTGLASGVNNAVARTASLIAVAVVPALVGLTEQDFADPLAFTAGFRSAMWLIAGLAALGGVIGYLRIRDDVLHDAEPTPSEAAPPFSCPVDAPPVRVRGRELVGAAAGGRPPGRPAEPPTEGADVMAEEPPCSHLDLVDPDARPTPPNGCRECLQRGDTWVHLRMCSTCGHVGCCDSSRNRHASRHARDEGHPVLRSYEPGEAWWYCFADDASWEVEGVGPVRS